MKKIFIYLKSILIPLISGAVVGFITSDYMDFNLLIKPNFAPPGFLFPVVWTILYILMGISYGILKNKNLTDNKVVNLLWSIIFFVFKWRLFAYLWILVLIVLVINMIKEFYSRNKISGLLQIPYLIWIIFASFLNLSIYLLNR